MKSQPELTGRRFLPDSAVCRRYSISAMTLWRWDHTPSLNFPPPLRVNNRKYRDEDALIRWERDRAAAA